MKQAATIAPAKVSAGAPLAASSQEIARLKAQYPHFASRMAKVTLQGPPVVEKIGGHLSVSQRYRLEDGTIVPLPVE